MEANYGNFTEYEIHEHIILGIIEQNGHYIWATDTPCKQALKDMIANKIVTFKEQQGILAIYIPLVKEYKGFKFK